MEDDMVLQELDVARLEMQTQAERVLLADRVVQVERLALGVRHARRVGKARQRIDVLADWGVAGEQAAVPGEERHAEPWLLAGWHLAAAGHVGRLIKFGKQVRPAPQPLVLHGRSTHRYACL